MKKLFISFACVYLLFSDISFAQTDTLKKNILGINLFQIIANGEVGFSFDHSISKRFALCFSTGYRLHQFHLSENQGFIFPNLEYNPGKGIHASIGFKKFYGLWRDKSSKRYIMLLFHYKKSWSTKGIWYYGNSMMGGQYKKSFYDEKYNLGGISFGTGFENHKTGSNVFDFGVSIGIYYGPWVRHYTKNLEWDPVAVADVMKNIDKTSTTLTVLPFIQLRLNFGKKI